MKTIGGEEKKMMVKHIKNRMEGVKLKIPPLREKVPNTWSGSSKLSICFLVTITLRSRKLG